MSNKKKNTKKVRKDNELKPLVKWSIIITFLNALVTFLNTIYTTFFKK